MTRAFVVALGALLALSGLFLMWQGWDIVQVERGWTQVIAGASFVGSGVVTIAIGLLIGALRGQGAAQLRQEASPRERKPVARPTADIEPVKPIEEQEKAPDTKHVAAIQDDAPPMPAEIFEAPREPDHSEHPGAWINEALATVKRQDGAEASEASAPGSEGAVDARSEVEAHDGDGPKIVGRYTIGGVHYTLHDNGAIEGRTPSGIVRFASLEELRAHIETESRRD